MFRVSGRLLKGKYVGIMGAVVRLTMSGLGVYGIVGHVVGSKESTVVVIVLAIVKRVDEGMPSKVTSVCKVIKALKTM